MLSAGLSIRRRGGGVSFGYAGAAWVWVFGEADGDGVELSARGEGVGRVNRALRICG